MKDFHTLAIFTYPHEFAVLKLLLEQEEIRHYFLNEMTIGVFPFYSNAIGGIHLKVHRKDFERAREVLEKLNGSFPPLKIV